MTVKGENITLCNLFPLCWGLEEASPRENGLQVEQIWKRWRQNGTEYAFQSYSTIRPL